MMFTRLIKAGLLAGVGLCLGMGTPEVSLSADVSVQLKKTTAVFSAPSPKSRILMIPGRRGEAFVDLVDTSPDETGKQWILIQFEDRTQGWIVANGLKPSGVPKAKPIAPPEVRPAAMPEKPYVDPRSEKSFVVAKPVRTTWLQETLLSLRRYFSRQ